MSDSSFTASGLKIVLALPDKRLRPNYNPASWKGRMMVAALAKAYKTNAYYHTRALIGSPGPKWKRAVERAVFYIPHLNIHPDGDNALGSLKHAFDGMEDAELLANDKHLRHLPVEWREDKKNPRVEIEIVRED